MAEDLLLSDSTNGKVTIQLDASGNGPKTDAPVYIDGAGGEIHLGGGRKGADVFLMDTDRTPTIQLDASGDGPKTAAPVYIDGAGGEIHLGGPARKWGQLFVKDHQGKLTIELHGGDGEIYFHGNNADCAEEFDIAESESTTVEPGTVVVLGNDGKMRPSREAYDTRVAGVISGAGYWRPGIVLDRKPSQNCRMPIALVGKVFCKVDARYAPIEVGDLLTTSPTLGCAMRAGDPSKAFGAVIGKALCPLKAGQALVPILIALQ